MYEFRVDQPIYSVEEGCETSHHRHQTEAAAHISVSRDLTDTLVCRQG